MSIILILSIRFTDEVYLKPQGQESQFASATPSCFPEYIISSDNIPTLNEKNNNNNKVFPLMDE